MYSSRLSYAPLPQHRYARTPAPARRDRSHRRAPRGKADAFAGADDLKAAYGRVSARFAADLADPRDLALSRAAALMLVQGTTPAPSLSNA